MLDEIDLNKISTEKINKDTSDIDTKTSLEIVKLISSEDKKVSTAVEKEIEKIAKVIDFGYESLINNKRIIYIGAGTSGRLGILDASEMPPTYGVSDKLIVGIIAGGSKAISESLEQAEDDKNQAIADLKQIHFEKGDLLIGISASGRTPYVLSAINYAKSLGSIAISLSTSKNSLIGEIANLKIEAIVGAEVIAGSTRMKSGTAQKMILNMISTGVMIKYGRVYKNLMVDVNPSNKKLIERAIVLTQTITGMKREELIPILKQVNYSPKLASIMAIKKTNRESAIIELNRAKGKLRDIIGD